jgi:hypothetical protein
MTWEQEKAINEQIKKQAKEDFDRLSEQCHADSDKCALRIAYGKCEKHNQLPEKRVICKDASYEAFQKKKIR